MCIRIRRPIISTSFLQLSRGSFATFPSLFLILLTSPLWVPSASVPFGGARPSFDQSSHGWRRLIMQVLQLLLLWLLLSLFLFFGSWCDPWGHHGVALAHGCSPWLSFWWDVSSEHPCRTYSMSTGLPWLFRSLPIFFSRCFSKWGWCWWWWGC